MTCCGPAREARAREAARNAIRTRLLQDEFPDDPLAFAFDETNPEAERWARTKSATEITRVGTETILAARAMIGEMFTEGIPPAVMARRIREVVGLHPLQRDFVRAVEKEIRDKAAEGGIVTRFPAREGVRSRAGFRVRVPKGGLREEVIRARVAEYSRMQRNWRARNIARTESIRAANEGQNQLWRQAQQDGKLGNDVVRVWLAATGDPRTCPICEGLDGTTAEIDGLYEDGSDGPPAHQSCRCGQGLQRREGERPRPDPSGRFPPQPDHPTINPGARTTQLLDDAKATGRELDPDEVYNSLPASERAKLDRLVGRAEDQLEDFENLVRQGARRFGFEPGPFENPQANTFIMGPVKSVERAAEKVVMKYGGRTENLYDMLRATYVVDDPADVRRIIDMLEDIDSPFNVENRFLNPVSGYRDVILNVRMPSGWNGEIQIHVPQILKAKNGRGHVLYERMRVLEEGTEEYIKLQRQSERLYGRAWAEVCAKFVNAPGCDDVVPWPLANDAVRQLDGDLADDILERTRAGLQFSSNEQDAIRQYTFNAFDYVNTRLRGGTLPESVTVRNVDNIIKRMNEAMARAPELSDDVVVWRMGRVPDEVATAKSVRLPGFQSSSLAPHEALEFDSASRTFIEIRVPKGNKALYVDHISRNAGEFEMILPHNAEYRVLGRTTVKVKVRKPPPESGFAIEEREVLQLEMVSGG